MDDLEIVRNVVSNSMDDILENFKQPAKITILVRRPGFPEQDFCLSNDDPKEAILALKRRSGPKS